MGRVPCMQTIHVQKICQVFFIYPFEKAVSDALWINLWGPEIQ